MLCCISIVKYDHSCSSNHVQINNNTKFRISELIKSRIILKKRVNFRKNFVLVRVQFCDTNFFFFQPKNNFFFEIKQKDSKDSEYLSLFPIKLVEIFDDTFLFLGQFSSNFVHVNGDQLFSYEDSESVDQHYCC